MTTIYTFGDSVLDCARYNEHGITPTGLLASNDDVLFPEFRGRDLRTTLGRNVSTIERAVDGSTVSDLLAQIEVGPVPEGALTLLTIGGNDLLLGLVVGDEADFTNFRRALRSSTSRLEHTRLLIGNVYDPSFRDDRRNFLSVEPVVARSAHRRVNTILAEEASRVGATLVDLHAHFLGGDSSWFTRTIEPSLTGASEIRRTVLRALDL